MTRDWITDRPPTAADGDEEGEVRMKASPDREGFHLIHWSYVGACVPWRRTSRWKPPAQPAPTEPDRIAALEQRVVELEAFKRALMQPSPMRYSLENRP